MQQHNSNKDLVMVWMDHPMTKLYLKMIQKELDLRKEELEGAVLNIDINSKAARYLSKLRGEISMLDVCSKPKEFLTEYDLEELNKDEDIGSSSSIEDAYS